VKWDLDNWLPMQGRITQKIEKLIKELVEENQI